MMSAASLKDQGNGFYEQGKFEEAIESFTKAIAMDPNDHRFYSNRSAAHLANGDPDLALLDAEKCIAINPDFAKGHSRKEAALLELSLFGELIEMKIDAIRGRFVVAKTRLDPGTLGLQVLEEPALIIVPPPSVDDETVCGINPHSYLGIRFANYLGYMKQTATVQRKIMGFYKEMDCPKAVVLRNELIAAGLVDATLVEEIVAVDMAFEFNAVMCCPATSDGSSDAMLGTGLFTVACRMSHSCRPNTVWLPSQDGRSKHLRVIEPIDEGEELTIDYIGSDSDLRPTHERREVLEKTKSFLCECHRCVQATQNGDDTRRFYCDNHPDCPGVVFVCQPLSTSLPSFTACTICHTETKRAAAHLRAETTLKSELDSIRRVFDGTGVGVDMQEVMRRIQRLRPLHPHHYLAIACAGFQGELCCQLGDWGGMARAFESSVAARDVINGPDHISRNTAFDCERAGDAYAHFDLIKAQEVYRRAVRILQISDGSSQPRWKLVVKKLVEVQRRLGNNTGSTTSTGTGTNAGTGADAGSGARSNNGTGTGAVASSTHGSVSEGQGLGGCSLCGAPAQSRCARCPTVYCCRDHQKAHFTVHKQQCQ